MGQKCTNNRAFTHAFAGLTPKMAQNAQKSEFWHYLQHLQDVIAGLTRKMNENGSKMHEKRAASQVQRPPRPICRVECKCVRKWLRNAQKSELLHNLQDLQDLFAG